jgi:hypothetical protein
MSVWKEAHTMQQSKYSIVCVSLDFFFCFFVFVFKCLDQ